MCSPIFFPPRIKNVRSFTIKKTGQSVTSIEWKQREDQPFCLPQFFKNCKLMFLSLDLSFFICLTFPDIFGPIWSLTSSQSAQYVSHSLSFNVDIAKVLFYFSLNREDCNLLPDFFYNKFLFWNSAITNYRRTIILWQSGYQLEI